jgi:hypothetical protein
MVLADPQAPSLWRGGLTPTLDEQMTELGAEPTTLDALTQRVVLVIGDVELPDSVSAAAVVRVSWNSWVALAAPEGSGAGRGDEDTQCVLAPLAAAALAIDNVFAAVMGTTGALDRRRRLDLWEPRHSVDHEESPSRPIAAVPAQWWLVGLGHLGQGFAWTLSWLPQPDLPVTVTVQDEERIVEANLGTGLCSRSGDLTSRKTRAVARVLKTAGYDCRIVDRRLAATDRPCADELPVVLYGVDNTATRRQISDHGWPAAVDVGLGGSAGNFRSMTIRWFPGTVASGDVASWRENVQANERMRQERMNLPGFQALGSQYEICGMQSLAGVNVAVPFVGLAAATLTIAQVIKAGSGEGVPDALGLDLRSNIATASPTHIRLHAPMLVTSSTT